VIRLLSALFGSPRAPWIASEYALDYDEDRTQWIATSSPLTVTYQLSLTKADDPALVSFIEKIASQTILKPTVELSFSFSASSSNEPFVRSVAIDTHSVDVKAAREIEKRLEDSNLLFLYNSTLSAADEYYSPRGRPRRFYDFVMSAEEKKTIDLASKDIENKLRRLAKQRMQGLSEMLDRLTDKYDVELSTPEGFATRRMPLGINLRDHNVKVPINDWGSGTQNRTYILMSLLQAYRIKGDSSPDEKITPIVVIEEPESFLHPSAQSEFGRILRHLAGELGLQIIVTTHSPYMLNQEEPDANVLLTRVIRRHKAFETTQVETVGDSWMAPFAEHLGISTDEFASVRPIFASEQSKVLLVEGGIDKEYFQWLQKHTAPCERLASEIEVVPYGGKDTLKNTLLLQFVLRKFDRVFVTYDLDAHGDVGAALKRAGLKEDKDFIPLGVQQAGKDCMEGMLPQRVIAAVHGRETDLVMKLSSNTERRRAKEELKQKYLEEFKSHTDYSSEELKALNMITKKINMRFK
jgi:predicted ATP-dependent endonuclease of OLD family